MRTPAAWLRSCRRRKPGVYAYRTRRHLAPTRVEWGYVGKSRNLDIRAKCHAGTCGRHASCIEKPWQDLIVRRHTIRLPWWLGWDWVTLPLETALIWALRPRYNVAKNPRRGKVPIVAQRLQRAARDRGDISGHRLALLAIRMWDITRVLGLIMIIVGTGGWLWNR